MSPAPRSTFVTALAAVFIALGAGATLIGVMQNIMITMFPVDQMRDAWREADKELATPWLFRLMFENFRLIFAAFLAASVLTLVSAVGLLLRKNWARYVFIAMMVLAILWNSSGLYMPFLLAGWLAPNTAAADFTPFWRVIAAFSVVMSLAFMALFAWIIKRLVSPEIRAEFLAR